MKESHIKILKTMNEATNRMDLNMFAEAVNLTPNEAITEVQELAKEGFLRKVGGGFGLTEKGRNALKAFTTYPNELSFHFYVDLNKPLGFSAQSIMDFYRYIKQVTADSLEFHLHRGDFENWVKEVCRDPELAASIGSLKSPELNGEVLRNDILKAIDTRYGINELL